MYRAIGNVVYGFHGCDIQTKEAILKNNDFFKSSKNTYDWLGPEAVSSSKTISE